MGGGVLAAGVPRRVIRDSRASPLGWLNTWPGKGFEGFVARSSNAMVMICRRRPRQRRAVVGGPQARGHSAATSLPLTFSGGTPLPRSSLLAWQTARQRVCGWSGPQYRAHAAQSVPQSFLTVTLMPEVTPGVAAGNEHGVVGRRSQLRAGESKSDCLHGEFYVRSLRDSRESDGHASDGSRDRDLAAAGCSLPSH